MHILVPVAYYAAQILGEMDGISVEFGDAPQ
jgi:hypothetical protein